MSKKIKFVFHHPNSSSNWFKSSVLRALKKEIWPSKYGELMDHILASEHEVAFTTSFKRCGGLKGCFKWLTDPLDLILWCILNKISLKRVKLIFKTKLLSDYDFLFLMHYGNFTHQSKRVAREGLELAKRLAPIKINKIVHMSHYQYNIGIGAENLTILNPDICVAESQLISMSDFYLKYFNNIGTKFYVLPYYAASRFRNITLFKGRSNRALASGSITYPIIDEEFFNFFGSSILQPTRKEILANKDSISNQITCKIFDLASSSQAISNPPRLKNLIYKLYSLLTAPESNSYYKEDIVSLYNNFKMFVTGDEVSGLPAISFIEAMACGCVCFSAQPQIYKTLGLVPGKHYITFDGSLLSLTEKISHYQARQQDLEVISSQGSKYVSENLNSRKVTTLFLDYLVEYLNQNLRE